MIKRLGVYNTVTYYIDVIKNREERKKYFEEEKRISSKLPLFVPIVRVFVV